MVMIVERIKEKHSGFQPTKTQAGTHLINQQNWVNADHVQASFDIQHDGTSIYLHYFVKEDHVRAVNSGFNSSVWRTAARSSFSC